MRVVVAGAALLSLTVVPTQASEPIEIEFGVGRSPVAVKSAKEAEEQLKKGDYERARRSVEAAIRADPTFWPALFTRAKLFLKESKWALAIQDCNQMLRQDSTFVPAALVRAEANMALGNYAASLKELDHVISIRPREQFFAMAFNARALFRATCPDASFRNGRQAISDAKLACNMTHWKEADPIDTLAAAHAEAGDFDSAVRYEQQAMSAGDAGEMTRTLQEHLATLKQHRPIRSVSR